MTDQELKDLVASFAVDSREREERNREFEQQMKEMRKETERIRQENSLQMKKSRAEFDLRMEILDKKLDKIGIKTGNIDANMGHHAEQFFQDVFEKKLEFGGMKYDEMIPNLTHKGKKDLIEFDIALLNGDSIALIEVKNRIHPGFVKELAEERIEKFRKYFLEFSDYKVYLGIAGFSFCDEVLDRASAYGIGIIKQAGEGVEVKADSLRAY